VLPGPGPVDLSAYRGISLRFRMVDFANPGVAECTLYLQLGETGEDLDGDGVLDAEASGSSAGFSFDDSDNLVALRVGSGPRNTGNARRDSEDVDANGVLDAEDPAWLVTLTDPVKGVIDADTDWTVVTHTFSAAERAALRRARGLRLLVVETGAAAVSGRLLVDHVSLEGSPFSVSATGVTATAREVEEQYLPGAPAESLEEAYPEVAEVFHPLGERQKVLAVEWQGGNGTTDSWQLKGYVGALSEGIDYREIIYYYYKPTDDGGAPSFALTDAEDEGVSWTLPDDSTPGWREVRVSLEEGRVYRDGDDVGAVSGTLKGKSIAVFTVTLDGADEGSLYLDELHLADPRGALGGGGIVDLQLQLPGELVAVGGRTLLRDLSVREELSGSSSGFSSLYGAPAGEGSFSSRTDLAVGISAVDLSADFTVRAGGGELDLGGGHSLSVPLRGIPVRFSDSFRLDSGSAGPQLSRSDSFSLALPPLVFDLETTAQALEDTLSQRWLGRLVLSPGPATLASRLELSEAAADFVLPEPDGGYLTNWLQAYALVAPWRHGEPLERKGDLSLDFSLATAPVGLRAVGRYGFHSFDLTDPFRSLQSSLSLDLSLPLAWSAGQVTGFSLTPGYRRTLFLRTSEAGTGEFSGDFAASWQRLADQGYAFAALPVFELYDREAAESFAERTLSFSEALFEAEGYLRLSRRVSSRLVDLLLPSSLELALGRSLQRAGDLTSDSNLYALSARSVALNLFGSLGAFPLVSFYRTDEFASSARLALREQGGSLDEGEVLLEHYASFEGSGGRQLTIRNRCTGQYDTLWSVDDTLELLYGWERRPPQGVRLPLLPAAVGREGYWTHLESLALQSERSRHEDSYHPIDVVLTHESALVLPEHGSLKASLGLGFDLERTAEAELYWRFGLRGGLELRIEF